MASGFEFSLSVVEDAWKDAGAVANAGGSNPQSPPVSLSIDYSHRPLQQFVFFPVQVT
jgi:hypothetical protein